MSQTINTNIASLTAQRNLSSSQGVLNQAIQRLSSGLRINSAKDDAAGLAISERMSAQIRGLNQATRNAQDAISLSQTAEGALGSVSNNLQRIRELAVQAANGTNSATDRAALDQEAQQLVAEIQRVASQTQFNGISLLDGTFSGQAFQVGANQNQTISISSIANSQTSALGSNLLSTAGTAMNRANTGTTVPSVVTQETGMTLTTANGGTSSSIAYAADSGANTIAAAINTAGANVGLSATASNTATISTLSAAGTVGMTLNGTAISAAVTSTSDLSALAAAINGVSGTTGVSASFADPNNKSSITLTTSDGRDIQILNFTHSTGSSTVAVAGGNASNQTLTDGATDSARIVGKVDIYSSKGAITAASANTDAFATATATSAFSSVAALSLAGSDGSAAQSALRVIDDALTQINSARASLGAVQNRFESTISNLNTMSENMSASRSRIQDADFAQETAKLTRAQILQQAGTAVLAQANAIPNNVLSLLR